MVFAEAGVLAQFDDGWAMKISRIVADLFGEF